MFDADAEGTVDVCATGCALAGVPGAGVGSSRLRKEINVDLFCGAKARARVGPPPPALDTPPSTGTARSVGWHRGASDERHRRWTDAIMHTGSHGTLLSALSPTRRAGRRGGCHCSEIPGKSLLLGRRRDARRQSTAHSETASPVFIVKVIQRPPGGVYLGADSTSISSTTLEDQKRTMDSLVCRRSLRGPMRS
jgi:hypothetical protein